LVWKNGTSNLPIPHRLCPTLIVLRVLYGLYCLANKMLFFLKFMTV